MRDGDDDGMDDDEDDMVAVAQSGMGRSDAEGAGTADTGGAQSKLVRDILDEQKDAREAQTKKESSELGSNQGGGIRMRSRIGGARKSRSSRSSKDREGGGAGSKVSSDAGSKSSGGDGLSNDELEDLRRAIQTLSQSTHPLAKCMDYVHDDVELMRTEAEEWQTMYRSKLGLMEEASKTTENVLQEQQSRVEEIKDDIEAEKRKIRSVKASIARNDQRIAELIQMVVHVN